MLNLQNCVVVVGMEFEIKSKKIACDELIICFGVLIFTHVITTNLDPSYQNMIFMVYYP